MDGGLGVVLALGVEGGEYAEPNPGSPGPLAARRCRRGHRRRLGSFSCLP